MSRKEKRGKTLYIIFRNTNSYTEEEKLQQITEEWKSRQIDYMCSENYFIGKNQVNLFSLMVVTAWNLFMKVN